MEQKKTLWIIAAVGAFLLVVLAGAAIMCPPQKTISPTIASVSPVDKGIKNNKAGWTNPPVEELESISLPQDIQPKQNDLIVLADNATVYDMGKSENAAETTIDLNSLKKEIIAETQPQNINITVNVPDTNPSTPVVEKTPAPVKTKTEASPAKTVTEVKKVNKANTKTNITTNVVKTAPKAESVKTQFWVQVAAYGNKKGAEGARSVLDENKIPSDIFTFKDNKGKLFYRVRVGPYTTKGEAEYWRSKIIQIYEFSSAESYITSTTN